MRHLPESGYFWLALASAVLLIGVVLTVCFWDWLRPEDSTTVSNSETLRNVGLLVGGALAFVFAGWRAWLAEQEKATARRQADIAQQSLLNERYERGAEMLGSSVLSVRLGGIGALQGLAEQHPEQYHVPVMQQLCSFVRHPTEVDGQPVVYVTELELGAGHGARTRQDYAAAGVVEIEVVREDIQAAMDAITSCHARNLQIETQHNYWIDLHGAELRGVDLSNKDLSGAPESAQEAPFNYAMIGPLRTNLRGTKLRLVRLPGTNLTGCDLSRSSGLTQYDLDEAYAEDRMPPVLDYAFDDVTGEELVWRQAPGDR